MVPDLTRLLERLGVSLDLGASPIVSPGLIGWLGRLIDVDPNQLQLGLKPGMEVWSTGDGFAPIDLPSVESWLFDAPRGIHLLISLRELTFDRADVPVRVGRELIIWSKQDLAEFLGMGILGGTLELFDPQEIIVEQETEKGLFDGPGPFVLKPSEIHHEIDLSFTKPILIPATLYHVKGLLKGPGEDQIERWVLRCGGVSILHSIELLKRIPALSQYLLDSVEEPDFGKLLSERRTHNQGMGDLLHWWKFEEESKKVIEYDVLVPANIKENPDGSSWVFDSVSQAIYKSVDAKHSSP
jgi:hypothetical protein